VNRWLLALLLSFSPALAERPLPHRDPPFAKGYAEKIELFPKRLTVRTRETTATFTWNDRTYFFRGQQKIVPEQINPGDLIALRYTTTPDGALLIQRLKVIPPPDDAP